MYIKEVATGKIIKVEVLAFHWKRSYQTLFKFNWNTERLIYALHLVAENDKVMGLIALQHYPEEARIHINLLEVNNEDVGKHKKHERIAGCLIAFACQLSKQHYKDFPVVSLTAKTNLIHIYRQKYGFTALGNQMMFVEGQKLLDLIHRYITEEK